MASVKELTIRTLFKNDIKTVLAIEASVHVVPWTEETFETCFNTGYLGWVIEKAGEVIGFIIISLRRDECHILNLCIANAHQHQGFGRQLLQYALNHAKTHGAAIIYLEVRRSNAHAISLYRKMRFHMVGERKDYYPTLEGNEDALIFAKSLYEDFYQ